tara:strand:+ start:4935 stop:5138 length:204 start_codon:yes stop_codon:yes gene_type:complete
MSTYKIHFAHNSITRLYNERKLELKNTVGTPKCGNLNSNLQNITFNKNEVTCQKCVDKLDRLKKANG